MICFQFNGSSFNTTSACKIDMIISGKSAFGDPRLFTAEVIRFLDGEIYPGCNIHADYDGFHLKEVLYIHIIRWI